MRTSSIDPSHPKDQCHLAPEGTSPQVQKLQVRPVEKVCCLIYELEKVVMNFGDNEVLSILRKPKFFGGGLFLFYASGL